MNHQFVYPLLQWFKAHGRYDLPWQTQPTPYRIWISEIMLQQTQVATVRSYFNRFMQAFPEVQSLALADLDTVLCSWAGLGYYARGRNVHHAAQIIRDKYAGKLPANNEQLMALPGIGRSTAGAIMALAFKQRYAILDGNVKRVLSRFYAINGRQNDALVIKRLWQLAEDNTPEKNVAEYTQAIMDLGAMICKRSMPLCDCCPVAQACVAKQLQQQDQYPQQRAKKTLPLRKIIFLLLQNDSGEFLLQRRHPTGVWGGLWCFLECVPDDDITTKVLNETGYSARIIRRMSVIRHTLTHFKMDILPIHMRVIHCKTIKQSQNQQWYLSKDALKSAIPVPVKKLLLTMA